MFTVPFSYRMTIVILNKCVMNWEGLLKNSKICLCAESLQ